MPVRRLKALLPRPRFVLERDGTFHLSERTRIRSAEPSFSAAFEPLVERLRRVTGFALPLALTGELGEGDIHLTLHGDQPHDEGYTLDISPQGVNIAARTEAAIARASQTLRQLFPASIEHDAHSDEPMSLPSGQVRDEPRFPYRGVMLDVARHFFGVRDVQHVIELAAYFKLNFLHLHLSDDQGFRLEIDGFPALTTIGAASAVGFDAGGFYTQEEYAELVAFAARRHVTIVPEIDMPGHTGAMLSSLPELHPSGICPPLYTGTEVGHTSLLVGHEPTERVVREVLKQVARLTPGPFLHVGGDEAKSTKLADYVRFVGFVEETVRGLGKRMIGWEEVAQASLAKDSVVQHWASEHAKRAVEQGARLILSPSKHAYLDMKYDAQTPLGLDWAGTVDERQSYAWEPGELLQGVDDEHILGVEAPLWTETIRTRKELEFMMFPRLIGLAEKGWCEAHVPFDDYAERLGKHAERLVRLVPGARYSPIIPWS